MIILIGMFLVFLHFNCYTPLYPGDDFVYSFVFTGQKLMTPLSEDAIRISSFTDIINSSILHYQVWLGRITNHFLTLFFLWQDKIIFNVCNSIISVLLICLIVAYGNRGKFTLNKNYLIFTFISIWLFQINWSSIFNWVSGSCNYIWSTTIILLFLLPYYQYYYSTCSLTLAHTINKYKHFTCIFMFCVGLIAGCTNETFVCLMLGYLFLFLFVLYRNNKLESWQVFGFLGFLIGYLILMLSPSYSNRIISEIANACTDSTVYTKKTLIPVLESLKQGNSWFYSITKDFLFESFELFVFYFSAQIFLWQFIFIYFLMLVKYKYNNINESLKKQLEMISFEDKNLVILFFIGAFLSEIVMVISPIFPPRAMFFGLLLLIICSLILIRNQFHLYLLNFLVVRFFVFCLKLVFIVTFCISVFCVPVVYHSFVDWIDKIKIEDTLYPKSVYKVSLDEMYGNCNFPFFNHCIFFILDLDENHWTNASTQVYYKISGKLKRIK